MKFIPYVSDYDFIARKVYISQNYLYVPLFDLTTGIPIL